MVISGGKHKGWAGKPDNIRPKWLAVDLNENVALGPLVMNLLYQNSGWFQFGYRFSNDYAILLLVMLAAGVRRLGRWFWIAAAWAVAWNLLGAVTFEREKFSGLYSHDANAVYPAD